MSCCKVGTIRVPKKQLIEEQVVLRKIKGG